MQSQHIQRFGSWTLAMVVAAGPFWASSTAHGQTFLEQLEAAVRDQLDEPATPPQNELPPPATAAPATGNPAADQLPSILENSPASATQETQPPPPRPSANQPSPTPNSPAPNSPSPSGSIYLGLEAEEASGGGIGVRVSRVSRESPAWKAGFEVGDRILAVNGFAIANLDGMVEQLSKTAPGQTVKFLVSRADRNIELVAVLMDANLASRIAGGPLSLGETQAPAGPPWLGVMVNDLTASFRNQFGISVFRGAAVTSVVTGSPISQAGIRAGDAIVEMNGKPIENALDLTAWLATARVGQRVDVKYYRGSSAQTGQMILTPPPGETRGRTANRPAVANNALQLTPADNADNTAAAPPTPPAPPTAGEPSPGGETSATGELPTPAELPPAAPRPSEQVAQETIAGLEAEVARLNQELADANQRLAEMQRQLKQIVDGLNGSK